MCVFSPIWNFLCFTGPDSQFRYFQSFPKRRWMFSLRTIKDNIAFIGHFVSKRWRCIQPWCFRLGLGSLLWYHFKTFQRPVVSFGDNMMLYSCILDISKSSCCGSSEKQSKQIFVLFFLFFSFNELFHVFRGDCIYWNLKWQYQQVYKYTNTW